MSPSLLFLLLLLLVPLASCVAPVPETEVGYVYKSGSHTAPVRLDAYIDLVCIDSKNSWPVILSVADHYGPDRVQLVTHIYALPYLKNGFIAHKTMLIVIDRLGVNATYSFIERMFNDFDNLKAGATADITEQDIIQRFAAHAVAMNVTQADYDTMYGTWDLEWQGRVAWKHAAFRGVYATPTFLMNDVLVSENENTSLEQWKTKIDAVLGESE